MRKKLQIEIIKTVVVILVTILLNAALGKWFSRDLEYKVNRRDAYLSTTLGKQGVSMTYRGQPLKNVSVVDFSIVNRTGSAVSDVTLAFTMQEPASLVAAELFPPKGMPVKDTVSAVASADEMTRKFHLTIVPKDSDEHFDAIFLFDGEKAPEMKVVSMSSSADVIPFREWKDNILAIFYVAVFFALLFLAMGLVGSLLDYFLDPKKHRLLLTKFDAHAQRAKASGAMTMTPDELQKARALYASLVRPAASIWSRIFGDQKFDDID